MKQHVFTCCVCVCSLCKGSAKCCCLPGVKGSKSSLFLSAGDRGHAGGQNQPEVNLLLGMERIYFIFMNSYILVTVVDILISL